MEIQTKTDSRWKRLAARAIEAQRQRQERKAFRVALRRVARQYPSTVR